MNSVVLRTSSRLLVPALLLLALFLLGRGHDELGGGFAAAVTATAAGGLHALAFGARQTRRWLRLDPRRIAALGLALMLASGAIGLIVGDPFLSGKWLELRLPGGRLELGTPILFDGGVFLLVTGGLLTVLLAIEES